MHTIGLDRVPSIASLARIFRETRVARFEPKEKPRSWRPFVHPAPNACWQLDATDYFFRPHREGQPARARGGG
jgi:hypothetical protein